MKTSFMYYQLFIKNWGIIHQTTRSFLKEAVFFSVNLICSGGNKRLSTICWSDTIDLEFVGTKDFISSFKYISSTHLLIPLINIKNKKMESWTYPASPILEWNQEHIKCNFSWSQIRLSTPRQHTPPTNN